MLCMVAGRQAPVQVQVLPAEVVFQLVLQEQIAEIAMVAEEGAKAPVQQVKSVQEGLVLIQTQPAIPIGNAGPGAFAQTTNKLGIAMILTIVTPQQTGQTLLGSAAALPRIAFQTGSAFGLPVQTASNHRF
jgi:hypothetical protein